MAAFDYLTQLFQGSEKMRGLSGGVGSAVALDDANSFYNFRLRRHYTDEEITDEPYRLWFTNDDPDARTGLGPHIAEVLGEGQRFGDILVVLADDNWDWCDDIDGFREIVHQMINDRFRAFLAEQGVAAPSRPLGLWLVRDRSEDIGGADFGLVDGEFITGLLPNLYRAPGADSKPVVTLHMNIPGAWDGYRQVGQLFDDQPLMTVGNHWLDNVRHDALREAALYRLQRDDDGGFFHIVNPDLQGRYKLHTTEAEGTSVITLATREGEALAYLVLSVEEDAAGAVEAAQEPGPDLSSERAAMAASAEATPDIAAPMMGDDFALVDSGGVRAQPMASSVHRGRGGRTILPEAQTDRIFTLQERGVLFQKVHFHKFMLGYDVYVGTRGEVGTFVQPVSATFQIRTSSVSLVANADNVAVNGQHLPKGESVLIDGDAVVEIGNQRLEYRDLSQIDAEGWPYVGEIRRPASSTYMLWGQQYAIGRSRDCRVVLPDDKHQDNIVWKPGVVEGAMIKSKKGDIPKSQFYTDSIMVSAEHAAIDLSSDSASVETKSSGAFSFIRRDGELLPVYPARKEGPSQRTLMPGDEVLIGNCLFHVGFAPAEDSVMPIAPAPRLSSDSLVDAMTHADAESSLSLPPAVLPDPGDDDVQLTAPVTASAMAGLDDDPEPPSGFHVRPEPSVVASPTAQSRSRKPTASQVPELRDAAPASSGMPAPAPAAGDVVIVREGDAKIELARPARLVHIGWAVSGSVDVGNHAGCAVVIPESQLDDSQTFAPSTYFSLKVRGRKATLTPGPDAQEARIDGQVAFAGDVATRTLSLVRRDDEGEEDFTVDLTFVEDAALPDPRARLLAVDLDEPLAKALFVHGFPQRQPHRVTLHGLDVTGTFDGHRLTLTGYLDTYRTAGGDRPVFVQAGGERFVTAPEDGADMVLASGDRIVVDGAVYRFETA